MIVCMLVGTFVCVWGGGGGSGYACEWCMCVCWWIILSDAC